MLVDYRLRYLNMWHACNNSMFSLCFHIIQFSVSCAKPVIDETYILQVQGVCQFMLHQFGMGSLHVDVQLRKKTTAPLHMTSGLSRDTCVISKVLIRFPVVWE